MLPIPAPVYCGSLPVVQSLFSCPLLIGYGIAGNRVTSRIPCTSDACRIAPSRFGVEYPRPYALCCHHLPSPAPGAPPNYREGKSGVGKASLVREQWLVLTELP